MSREASPKTKELFFIVQFETSIVITLKPFQLF